MQRAARSRLVTLANSTRAAPIESPERRNTRARRRESQIQARLQQKRWPKLDAAALCKQPLALKRSAGLQSGRVAPSLAARSQRGRRWCVRGAPRCAPEQGRWLQRLPRFISREQRRRLSSVGRKAHGPPCRPTTWVSLMTDRMAHRARTPGRNSDDCGLARHHLQPG